MSRAVHAHPSTAAKLAASHAFKAPPPATQVDTDTLRAEIPQAMQHARRWLVWMSIPQAGKKDRKMPYYPDGTERRGTLDSPEDQARMGTFDNMLAALATGRYAGPGFALGPDGTGQYWQGIDLDNTDTRPELAALVEMLPGFVHWSPSGKGVHAIGYGTGFQSMGSNASGIEAYAGGRFFTVTADAIGGDVEDLAAFVTGTLAPLHRSTAKAPEQAPVESVTPSQVAELRSALLHLRADDRDLWQRMGHALKGLGDTGRGLWLEWSATSEKFDPKDASHKWESFKPERTGFAAVFAEAQRAGWVNPKAKLSRHDTRASETHSQNDVNDVNHVHQDPDPIAAAVAICQESIAKSAENPGALAGDEFNAAARLLREEAPDEWFRLRGSLKNAARAAGLTMGDIERGSRPDSGPADDSSTADELVALVQECAELFHATDGTCYATLTGTGPRLTFRLDTAAFSDWLSFRFYSETKGQCGTGRAASDTAIRTARCTLTGIARHDGDERPVYLRAARHGESYYIDVGSELVGTIEVTASGWRLVTRPPVEFWRPSTLRPLPLPVPGGDLSLLWQYANIPEAARPLVLAWLLDAWRPETPYPVLELVGQQGTAKSSTQAKLRRCIDPNAVDLRSAPKSVEDLFVSAGANWVASLNNLSHLSAPMQDALCNLATGGGFAGRTLFTNADETLIEAKRPVVLNGIVPMVTAQDLTDRVIHIDLPELETYRTETAIDADFERDAPQIIGGLLDLFVKTLATLPNVTLPRPPRMADYASLGEAMTRAQGSEPGTFMALYRGNRAESVSRSLEASPIACAVRRLVDDHPISSPLPAWDGAADNGQGTMARLLDRLARYKDGADAWPKTARGLGEALRRQRPALSQIGISVEIGKAGKHGIPVTIRRVNRDGERGERCERRLDGKPLGSVCDDDREVF